MGDFDCIDKIPGPNTELKAQDLLYVGVHGDANHEHIAEAFGEDINVITSRKTLSEDHDVENQLSIVQAVLEFDCFEFPEHCVNAILGPADAASQGQNALD